LKRVSNGYRSTKPVCVVCGWLEESARFERGGCVELANNRASSGAYRNSYISKSAAVIKLVLCG
jgi:hypothetical protein